MALIIWPSLVASSVGLVPFTIFSTLLVPIADHAGAEVAAVGSLRGLGGIAALIVGVAIAPVLDRIPRERAAALALAVLALAAATAAVGSLPALAIFCLLTGAGTALLTPALMAAAADRFMAAAASARAATLVTATTSLTAMLAAPLVALPAQIWGWRGDLVAVVIVALVLAAELLRRGRGAVPPRGGERTGYLAAFGTVARIPGTLPMIIIALLRAAAFMGYLAYLAALYDSRFGLSPAVFAFVWTLSGTSYFLSNLLAGRWLVSATEKARRLLVLGLVVGTAAMLAIHLIPNLVVALVSTALLAASHAAIAASLTTLLVRSSGAARGAALSLQAAAMNLGVFVGSAVGGLGLAFGGFPGLGVALATLTAVALPLSLTVRAR